MGHYFEYSPWQLALSNFLPWRGDYRPLGGLFYISVYHFAGLNPAPYQAVLLAILLANAYFAYRLVRLLGGADWRRRWWRWSVAITPEWPTCITTLPLSTMRCAAAFISLRWCITHVFVIAGGSPAFGKQRRSSRFSCARSMPRKWP